MLQKEKKNYKMNNIERKNMKEKFIILLLVLTLLPLNVFARVITSDYKTMNFVNTLKAEGMEIENKDYKENDQQAIIYMFRGDGCTYCRAFLKFLNSISKEYGEYFRLVSLEVWHNANNKSLMYKMPLATGELVSGVPYIIIGDKVFDGYSPRDDEKIKEAIKNQYEDNSFDAMKEVVKKSTDSNDKSDPFPIIFWNAFVIIAITVTIIIVNNKNTERILNAINKNEVKKEVKKKTK